MADKKEHPKDEGNQQENFTGSPEQQLPDLESEDIHDQAKQRVNEEAETDNPKQQR